MTDSSFSSVTTDDSYLSTESGNHGDTRMLSGESGTSHDMVVKEEAKEWKESVHKATNSPTNSIQNPASVAIATTPVAMVTPISSSTPYTSSNDRNNNFNHFRLTETGLIPMDTHTDKTTDLDLLQELKCGGCYKTFCSKINLASHMCLKLKCAECGYRSSTEEAMFTHVSTQHKPQLYKCGICDQGFKSPDSLEVHLTSVHDTPYSCASCGLVFVKFDLYQAHCSMECNKNNTAATSVREQCGECDTHFDSIHSLQVHMSTKHLISTPVSMTSPLTSPLSTGLHSNLDLSTQALLLKHSFLQKLVADLQSSLDKNPLLAKPLARFPPAAKCSSLLNSPPLFYPTALKPLTSPPYGNSEHAKFSSSSPAKFGTVTSPELAKFAGITSSPELAKFAGITSPSSPNLSGLTSPDQLTYSTVTSSPDRVTCSLLKCNQCAASFSTFSELHSHLLVHTVTMTTTADSVCGECDMKFTEKLSLEEHMKTAHDADRPYKCNHCDKTFTRSNNLQEHLRTHTGSRPYVCSYCDKSFARSSILHIHMRTHTKIKPFQCSVCPAAFSHSNSLQAHLRRHTGAKPYVCPVCSKAFRQSGTLHRHIRTHNKAKRSDQLVSPKQEPKSQSPFTATFTGGNHGNYAGGNFAGGNLSDSYATLALKLLGELRPDITTTRSNKENHPETSIPFLNQFKQSI